MSTKNPLIGFGVSEQVTVFLLDEAFKFANVAAAYAVASELFAERIESINPEPGWKVPAMPDKLIDWLAHRDRIQDEILDPNTIARLAYAWQSSERDSYSCGRKISKTKKLQSITDVVGHVINLGACIESVINRHLFLLRETGSIAPDHYLMLDRTAVLPKILFCFKESVLQKKLFISGIKPLVSLRNHAVHFTVSSADALVPTCEDLLQVWRGVGSLFSLIKGEPTQQDLDQHVTKFTAKWLQS